MAITKVERTVMALNEGATIPVGAQSAAFGVDFKGGDYKTLLLFANAGGSSATVTIAKGNGFRGAGEDMVVTVAAGTTVGVVIDSGYFKNLEGEYANCVKVTPSASLNVSAIELPQ